MQIFASGHAIEQACETLPDQTLRKLFQERYLQHKKETKSNENFTTKRHLQRRFFYVCK